MAPAVTHANSSFAVPHSPEMNMTDLVRRLLSNPVCSTSAPPHEPFRPTCSGTRHTTHNYTRGASAAALFQGFDFCPGHISTRMHNSQPCGRVTTTDTHSWHRRLTRRMSCRRWLASGRWCGKPGGGRSSRTRRCSVRAPHNLRHGTRHLCTPTAACQPASQPRESDILKGANEGV
jgi:hypothetical protein